MTNEPALRIPCPTPEYTGYCELVIELDSRLFARVQSGMIHGDCLKKEVSSFSLTVSSLAQGDAVLCRLRGLLQQFLEENRHV